MSLPADQITQSFTKAFNEAQALLAQDKMAECEQAARALLEESTMPRYHRIRTLLLLVNIVDEWYEAWRFHREAKQLWYLVRHHHPQGQDSGIDRTMEDLWDGIIELQEMLDEDMKPDEEPEDEIEAKLAEIDEQAKETEEWNKAEEEADALALGMTIDEMRAKTASKAALKNNSRPPVPKHPFGLAPSQAATTKLSSETGVATLPHVQTTDSKAKTLLAQSVAESRAYGFGGGTPYRNPMKKQTQAQVQEEPNPSAPVDPSDFQMEGAPPLLGRARSMRKKQSSYRNTPWTKSIPHRTQDPKDQGTNRGPEESNHNRPPTVLPKFAVELWGKPEEEKDQDRN